jgi:hypothetical protein
MPKKPAKKTPKNVVSITERTAKTVDAILAGKPSTTTLGVVAPTPGVYPQQTETRYLKVPLSTAEVANYSQEAARLVREIGDLENEKKAVMDGFKSRISDRQTRQVDISKMILDGYQEKRVECEWLFECAGLETNTNKAIVHPEQKTLVRKDTNEVVEVAQMTDQDFNKRELAIEEQKDSDKLEAPAGEEQQEEGQVE